MLCLPQVFKPNASAFIHVFEDWGGNASVEVLTLDVSTSSFVTVQPGSVRSWQYQLEIVVDQRLHVGAKYFVTIDRGVVVGADSCGARRPFIGLTGRSVWTFTTTGQGAVHYLNCHFENRSNSAFHGQTRVIYF